MKTTTRARGAPKALLALAAAALVLTTGAGPQEDPTGSWAAITAGENFSAGGMASDGTYLYTVGGLQMGGFPQAFAQLRRYDPATNTWDTLATLPQAVSDSAAAYFDGVIYSFGGSDPETGALRNSIQAYTIGSNSWDILSATLTVARQGLAASELGGRIYLTGGYDGNTIVDTTDEFNPATGNVQSRAAMPAGLQNHAMAAASGRLYVATGFDNFAGPVDSLYEFNPATNSWDTMAALPAFPRYGAAAFSLQNRVYVTGGLSGVFEAETWEYNPATNTWARRADMADGRYRHGAAALGAKGYVYGGAGVTAGEEYTPPDFAPPPTNVPPTANAGGNRSVDATSSTGATVLLDGSGSTDSDGTIQTYTWTGPFTTVSGVTATVFLPLGNSTVTLIVTDDDGASDSDTVVITVVDSEAPVFTSLAADPCTLWSPNHDMRAITVSATATDAGDSSLTFEIIGVTSNQSQGNDSDWEITGALTLNLRAERDGGQTRVYTISVRCTDNSGNSTVDTTTVVVPHNQGGSGQMTGRNK